MNSHPQANPAQEDVGCIVGVVVQLHPQQGNAKQQIQDYQHIEIHAEDEQQRLVITIEGKNSREVMRISEDIQQIEGVLQITPVYHHCEDNIQNDGTGGWAWR